MSEKPRRRWREQFPYHWGADERVGRREFLRISVLASGALFIGTAFLGLLGRREASSGEPKPVLPAGELEVGKPHYFKYPSDEEDAVMIRLESGQVVAYDQKCTHLACGVYYEDDHKWLYCPCHSGAFNAETGDPVKGPPQRPLARIRVEERDGMLYAMERLI